MEYKLVRSTRRKTIGLQVKLGQVIVRAPAYLSNDDIAKIVKNKSHWLKAKVALQQERNAAHCANSAIELFVEGCLIWVRGQPKKLQISSAKTSSTYCHGNYIIVELADRVHRRLLNTEQLKNKVKKQLEKFFIKEAELYIPERLKILSETVALTPSSYKIRQYKARWGSCNSHQALSFNYLLMMSPDWVVDYVIIHELCHLKYLNHSSDFWLLVEKFYPEFKKAKQWLIDRQTELQWC